MDWTPEGLLQPTEKGKCLPKCRRCLAVCPFQDHTEDESVLAKARFGHVPGIEHTAETGYYSSAYVGYAGGFRERGASGGMASWFLASLLENGKVDRVVCVRPNPDPAGLFTYQVAASPDEVRAGAKSAYYPVELSQAIRTILSDDKRYAIIGLPCSLKALRLAMLTDRRLRERVVVLAGLVCGQTKSRAFSEYLIRSQAIAPEQVRSFSFREKDACRPASSYFARVTVPARSACLPWSGLYGKTWLSGEFTPRACRFCDDAFAEVADVSFMDAWLPEYAKDGRGTSIVLARSELARELIGDGMNQGAISLLPIPVDKVIASQAGVVEQKRTQLAYRLWSASKKAAPLRKRVSPVRPCWLQQKILATREKVRATSHVAFCAADSSAKDRLQTYHAQMRAPKRCLQALLFVATCRNKARGTISRLVNVFRPR
jgi:coenzyme F420-reducing hydrogenase beta subunit